MSAAKKLNETGSDTIDQRDAAPTPQLLMKFSEIQVARRAIFAVDECLRDWRLAIARSFKENAVGLVVLGLFHDGYHFGQLLGIAKSLHGDNTVGNNACVSIAKIKQPLSGIVHAGHSSHVSS